MSSGELGRYPHFPPSEIWLFRVLNWLLAVKEGETQHSRLQLRSGFRFLLFANCNAKWLSHTSVERAKIYKNSTYTLESTVPAGEKWAAWQHVNCQGNWKPDCFVWHAGIIVPLWTDLGKARREHRQIGTSKRSLCPCSHCWTHLTQDTKLVAWSLTEKLRRRWFPQTSYISRIPVGSSSRSGAQSLLL